MQPHFTLTRLPRAKGGRIASWRCLTGLDGSRNASCARRSTGLFEMEVDGLGAARLAQLAKCAGLDLADPLTCHPDTLADLLPRVLLAVDQAVAELDDPTLPV